MRDQILRDNSILGACSARPQSPVENELDNARTLYTNVHSSITKLEDKLQPALVTYPESNANNCESPSGDPFLLSSIKEINGAMAAMIKRIDDIVERCII